MFSLGCVWHGLSKAAVTSSEDFAQPKSDLLERCLRRKSSITTKPGKQIGTKNNEASKSQT